jgi:hypothetical protein
MLTLVNIETINYLLNKECFNSMIDYINDIIADSKKESFNDGYEDGWEDCANKLCDEV